MSHCCKFPQATSHPQQRAATRATHPASAPLPPLRESASQAIYHKTSLCKTQQPPPEQLGALLETALRAWDAGQQEEARALLQQAEPLAEQMGYL